ncbi:MULTISPECIES: hypothetical protein [unclassified Pedobacter]|uniref:hypothetical protein n=1 Tax=unclassified Pedobacter TaxID=2628915 RepID=UPI001DE2F883|nr:MULTISPECIES: hypothetical protein [unclassified Pedobacter]CAH0250258.1 hypothetical protein SRABI36_03198 [Pedobacter sp. Bi36]CAH0275228.1 hypothetical protein SRABI126_03600 [Pedobacter sp. Bi126]
MKNNYKFLFALLFLFLKHQLSFGQFEVPKVIPPSPDVASLTRYAEIPVSYSTGVPDVSVPIYTVKTGSISLPISISYHASGIKVRDIASVVGLGWALNAGGTVARTVLGRRDESLDYISPYKTTDDLQTARTSVTSEGDAINLMNHFQNMNKNNFETQSDRYAYNFGGKSGFFRFDWINGSVRLIPYAPLKITKEYIDNNVAPQNLYYAITDESGTKYYFQAAESTTQGGMSPTTAWNLTRVVSADQKDEIKLHYSSGEVIVQLSEVTTVARNPGNGLSGASQVPSSTEFVRTPIGSQNYPKRLDSITTTDAIVKFEYSGDRVDGRQMRLVKVTVNNRVSNDAIKEVTLGQSYFGTSTDHTLRMRLDAIQVKGGPGSQPENYSYLYNNNVPPGYYTTSGYVFPGGSSFPPYILEDYWGYSGGGSGIPSEFLGFLNSSESNLYGGSRNPVAASVQDCILQQIKYPTGGKTVFEFENNRSENPKFYDYPNQTNANNGIVGGLRIKTIKNYSAENSLAFQKTYTYDWVGSEHTISSILFRYQQPINYGRSVINDIGSYTGHIPIGVISSNVATSSSLYPLSVLSGSPVVYGQVSEYNGTLTENTGKSVFTYYLPFDTRLESTNILSAPKFINEFTIDRGTMNPLLASKTVYKNINGLYTKVNQIENRYSPRRMNEFLTGIRVDQEVQFRDLTGYFSPDDYDTPYWLEYLNSYTWEATKGYEDVTTLDTTIITDLSDLNNPVSQTTVYNYDNLDHLLPTKKTVTDSKGGNITTEMKYPHDFTGTQPYTDMVDTYHMWAPVVEQLDYKNSVTPLSAVKNNYYNWGNNIVAPITIAGKTGTGNYESRVTFEGYDDHGKIKGVSKTGASKTCYLYSYRSQHPIAEIKNADYTTVESLLGGSPAVTAFSNLVSPDKTAIDNFLLPLRNNLPDAFISSYVYKPLVGMVSQTDAKGMTVYYEYDAFQRLKLIRDQNNNIVKTYCYNYAGQVTDCNAGGGTTTPQPSQVYARIEVLNPSWSVPIDGSTTEADIYLALYSDAACTQPVSLPQGFDVNVSTTGTYFYNNSSSVSSWPNTYSVPANTSRVLLGRYVTDSWYSYYDPYYGTIINSENYTYQVEDNGANVYIPSPTY